jgi:ligand-binding sensor domain-containing protein
VCAGGLDGLWTRRGDAWSHAAPRGGLPSNDISALAADGDTLWVGTFDHGLATFDGKRWTTIAGVDPRIDAIVVAPDAIWVGTAEGLVALDRTGRIVQQYTRRDGLPGRSVLALARLHDGRIVVGSSNGAAIVDGGHLARIGPRTSAADKGLGNVWAIAEDRDGSVWLGATTGLYHGPALAWSAKDGGEVGAWDHRGVATGELRDDWVTAIAVGDDAVWVGTYKGGVARVRNGTASIADGWVNPAGLAIDGDRVLAATMDGLMTIDRNGSSSTISGLPGRDVTAVARIGRTVWVATRRGLAST